MWGKYELDPSLEFISQGQKISGRNPPKVLYLKKKNILVGLCTELFISKDFTAKNPILLVMLLS